MTRILFVLAAVLAIAAPASAAPPTVESVSPAVGQRGAEFTLTLVGARLADPQELMLYAPGVVCTKLTAASENEVAVTLRAAADCRLGEYAFRLRTPGGASELRTFRITPFPVVAEKEPNDDPAHAQPVSLNTSVAGVIESAGVDCYAVTLKKGQRLATEVEAVRLGGELTDTVLTVFGPDGRQLVTVDDTPLFRQDPFVSLVAPADGVYVVQVRETSYGGGDASRYVMHVGTFARPAAVFPPGGQAGSEVKLKLLGDAAGEHAQVVKLPPAGTPFDLHPTDGTTPAPTAMPFRVSPFPNVVEGDSKPAAWPVAFNGIVAKPAEADEFRFRAATGDVIDVTAFAYRIGSPLDSVLTVLDAAGQVVAANDDDETHDSRVRVTIPADGEYVVRVTDKRKQGGPGYFYRIELDRPKPGLAVFLPGPARKSQDRQVIAVPRGNRVTAFLGVRRDGFDGPVVITPGELPTGVTFAVHPIAAGEYLVPVVIEAAAAAPLGGKLIELTGAGGDPKHPVTGGFQQVVTLTAGPGDSAFHSVAVSRLAVVVVDAVPVSVAVVPPAAPLAADGTLDLTVKVTRGKDFAGPVEVSFPALPQGVEAPATVVIPADKSEAVVTLSAQPGAELGGWRVVAEAKPAVAPRAGRDPFAGPPMGAGGTGRRPRRSTEALPPVASELVALTVAAAPVKGRFASVAAEQGKTARVVLELDLPAPLAGSFTATLTGLPPRVTAQPVALKSDAKRIEFTITVDPTSPPGDHPSLVCELAGEVGGQRVVYRVGRGGTLTVNPPGGVKTDASGKPLSPLDALRLGEKKP